MIEGILFLAVALLFAWWQFREIRKDQEEARRRREAQPDEADKPDGSAD